MSVEDEQHRNVVLFVFFASYLYFYYIQTKIDIVRDWANRKCNPLNMFIGSLYMPNDDSTKNFGTCVSQYTTDMIEKQVTNISNTTMGQMTTSIDNLNRNLNTLNKNVSNTGLELNRRYDTTNTSIRSLNTLYGSENTAKSELNTKITTFTGEMLNIFNHIKDYVKK
jgi:hypothetical protein